MGHVVLGNGVGDQPVDDLYVATFSTMLKTAFELVSPSTSSVGFSYLVYRPEGHGAACQPPTIPTTTNSTYPCRFWRDLLLHAHCGVDLLRKSVQRPIRDARHGQPIMPCSLRRKVALRRYPRLTGHAHHLHHLLHGHHPRRVGHSCWYVVGDHVYRRQRERRTKA